MKLAAPLRLAAILFLPLAAAACQSPPPLAETPLPPLERFDPEVAGQLSQAHAEAVRLASASPSAAAEAMGRLGKLYLAYELNDAALASFENARRLAPAETRWTYYLAVLRQEQGESQEAARLFREVLDAAPEDPAAWLRLANVQLEAGLDDAAEASFRQALQRDPGLAAAHFGLGRLAAKRRRDQEAVEAFQKTLQLQPAASQVHYALAQSYRRLGDLDRARLHLAKRGEVGVGFPDPAISGLAALTAGAPGCAYRGDRAALEGRLHEAGREYERAVALAPGNPDYRKSLALTRNKLGQWDAAIASMREAVRLRSGADAPNPVEASQDRYILGGMLANRGAATEAAVEFQQAVTLDPENIEAHFQLGRLAGGSGRLEEALAHLQRVLQLNPEHLEATRLTATSLMDLGRFTEALPHLRRLVQLEPGNDRNRWLLQVATERAG